MGKLDGETVKSVMVHVVRCPTVASQLQAAGVTGEAFLNSPYPEHAIIWDAVLEYYEKETTGTPPSFMILGPMVARRFHNQQELRQWVGQVNEFLRFIYHVPARGLNQNQILSPDGPLQHLIDDLLLAPLVSLAADERDPDKRNELITEITDVRNRSRVAAGHHISVFSPENMRKATAAAKFRKTGIDFIDLAIKGLPPVCACGLLGGTGGGKTTFSVQYTSECVFRDLNVLYAQYEEQVTNSSLLKRFMSFAAGLTRDELDGDYDDYPDEMKEKFDKLAPIFDDHLRMYSMAGDIPNQGVGGVPELRSIIRREIQNGWKPDVVIIDWLEPLVNRWGNLNRFVKAKDMRELYKYVVGQVVTLRDEFGIQAWLMHQIAGAKLEKMSPATRPDKNIAAELTSFPNLFNFCFCLGKKDEDSDCLWFGLPKARDAGNVHRIIKLDAQYNRFVDAHGIFELNDMAGVGNEPFFRAKQGKGARIA